MQWIPTQKENKSAISLVPKTHAHTHIHIREIHMHTYILRIDIVYNLQENKYIQSAGVQYSIIILKTSQK